MAKQVQQLHSTWQKDGDYISDTYAGQFLLKSGPDLFIDSRKVWIQNSALQHECVGFRDEARPQVQPHGPE